MINEIFVDGIFDKNMVKKFKQDLRSLIANDIKEIIVNINSYGGDGESMAIMNGFVYVVSKYKGFKFIAKIHHAESCALLFAVNMHERHVNSNSKGSIHLPVSKHEETKFLQTKHFVDIFVKQTHLCKEKILNLNNDLLNAKTMCEYGIATKLIEPQCCH